MKVPDLSTTADAGVHDWTGAPEPLKTAAAAAKLRFCSLDLHGIDNKPALLETLGKSLKLPEHFGNNWDALADCLEDSDWIGARTRRRVSARPYASTSPGGPRRVAVAPRGSITSMVNGAARRVRFSACTV